MILGRSTTLDFDSPVPCLSLPLCPVGTGKDFEALTRRRVTHGLHRVTTMQSIGAERIRKARSAPLPTSKPPRPSFLPASETLGGQTAHQHMPSGLPFASNLLAL